MNLTVTGLPGTDSATVTITVTPAVSTGSVELLTSSWGGVLKPCVVYSDEKLADLSLNEGVTALDADGNPLKEIEIEEIAEVPDVPTGATFAFMGYAVECSPAGATFAPAIDLTFNLSDEEWADALKEAGGSTGSRRRHGA